VEADRTVEQRLSTRISREQSGRGAALPHLALTCGDPAGIGLDITLAAWARQRHELPAFCLIAAPLHVLQRARELGMDVPIAEIDTPGAALSLFPDALPVLPVAAAATAAVPGEADDTHAPATLASIERAVSLTLAGHTSAVVTNPISKHVLKRAGFAFPGHTEFLAHLAERAGHPVRRAVMLMASPALRVVPVTIHIPLAEVPRVLSRALIIATAETVVEDMQRRFGLPNPRLAVTGLNPHAGEQGDIGREEIDVIAPAVRALQKQGHDVTGPLPADTLFHEDARRDFDVILAMYHDQALVPFKMISFFDGVNITLGLPFIRTSPDHGTAYGLAGTGRASPASLVAALQLAAEMAGRAGAASDVASGP
jgi:4-hydroxythreonine-4-phosphate dehydrogenase